jgi:hypothetical protein
MDGRVSQSARCEVVKSKHPFLPMEWRLAMALIALGKSITMSDQEV